MRRILLQPLRAGMAVKEEEQSIFSAACVHARLQWPCRRAPQAEGITRRRGRQSHGQVRMGWADVAREVRGEGVCVRARECVFAFDGLVSKDYVRL